MSLLNNMGHASQAPVTDKVLSQPLATPVVRGRSVKVIQELLETQKTLLEHLQSKPKTLKGNITRQKNKIKAKERIANDPQDQFAKSEDYYLRMEHRPKLTELEAELAGLPQRIEDVEVETIRLKEELEEAEAKELQLADERKARAKEAREAKEAKEAEAAQRLKEAAKEARKASSTRKQTSVVGAENRVVKQSQKPTTRRTTVKVPGDTTKTKAQLSRPMRGATKPALRGPTPSQTTAARSGTTTRPTSTSSQTAHTNNSNVAAGSASAPPRSTTARCGPIAGTKRRATNDTELKAPAKRVKLSNGRQGLLALAKGAPIPSPPSPLGTDTGSDVKDAPVLDGSKEQSTAPAQPAMAPSCPTTTGDKQGLARPVNKKRKAHDRPDTEKTDPASKRLKQASNDTAKDKRKTSSARSSSGGGKEKKRGDLNGLVNHNQSCFSAVIIQLLDAALEGHDIDAVLGELDEVHTFGLTNKDLKRFDNRDHDGDLPRALAKKQNNFRADIKAAAKADKVSPSKHLRSLLEDLRAKLTGSLSKHVSPYVFQSVMAFGAAEDADRAEADPSDRQKMSGDDQDECFEYYQQVLNALIEDTGASNSSMLKSLFEVETTTSVKCGCGYEFTTPPATNNFYRIRVPKSKNLEHANLGDLYRKSKHSLVDMPCPACSAKSLTSKTSFTKMPDNFVLKMDRASFDHDPQEPFKTKTLVDMPCKTFKILGSTYKVSALICHRGSTTDAGHYSIFRKLGETWYLLDDVNCSKKTEADVKDTPRGGQCAMLLLKREKGQSSS